MTITDPDGKKRDITDPEKMGEALTKENRQKYHQTESTNPFMTSQLRQDFGEYGEGPQTKNLMSGTYIPPQGLHNQTKDFLEVCKLPSKDTKLPRSILPIGHTLE